MSVWSDTRTWPGISSTTNSVLARGSDPGVKAFVSKIIHELVYVPLAYCEKTDAQLAEETASRLASTLRAHSSTTLVDANSRASVVFSLSMVVSIVIRPLDMT